MKTRHYTQKFPWLLSSFKECSSGHAWTRLRILLKSLSSKSFVDLRADCRVEAMLVRKWEVQTPDTTWYVVQVRVTRVAVTWSVIYIISRTLSAANGVPPFASIDWFQTWLQSFHNEQRLPHNLPNKSPISITTQVDGFTMKKNVSAASLIVKLMTLSCLCRTGC